MPLTRRQFHRALLASLATPLVPTAVAAPPARDMLVEGRDWAAIVPPRPGDSPGKVEVLEFFSYGCGHCRAFHPFVTRWAARLPPDVVFRRVPVSFGRAAWANLGRLYYTLEATGALARLDQAVFEAIHAQRASLYTEQDVLNWVAGQGVKVPAFRDAFRSFAVETKLRRAEQLVAAYKVDSVPHLTVAGRYAVLGKAAKDYADLLAIADALLAKARGRSG